MSGTINTVGSKSGVIGGKTQVKTGDSARSYLSSSMTNRSGETFTSSFTNDWIDNSAIFAHHADGLKVLISGTYLVTWGVYTFSASNSSPINETYFQEYLAYKNNGTPDTEISKTYTIFIRPHDGHNDRYRKPSNAHIIQLNANDVVAHRIWKNGGNNYTVAGGINDTFLTMTYLSEHT